MIGGCALNRGLEKVCACGKRPCAKVWDVCARWLCTVRDTHQDNELVPPVFWMMIIEVTATVGWSMSPTEIVKGCQARSKKLFHSLCANVVHKWINHTGPHPHWSDEMLEKVAKENCPGGNVTRRGILASNPETVALLLHRFNMPG